MSDDLPKLGQVSTTRFDNLQVRSVRAGATTGIPVLLTNPWPESIYAFRGVLPTIEGRHPVIAVDLPGFGRSEGRPDVMSPSAQRKRNAMTNKQVVLEAITGLFIRRDASVLETHFAPDYRQHNPTIGNGVAALRALAPTLSPNLRYEPGMIVGDGDIVMIHGRYVGWAEKPLVAVDIFRVRDGKLLEHWDVMQEEVPASATASGNPMFTVP